jgi:integrase
MPEKYIQPDMSKGKRVFRFQPKKYIRDALGIEGTTFKTETEANAFSRQVQNAYAEWKAKQAGQIHIDDLTVDGLIAYYFSTSEFRDIKPNSKAHYRLVLRTASETILEGSSKPFGRLMYKHISAEQADKLKQKIEETVSKHRSVHCVKALRRVWYVAMRHGKGVSANPFFKMGLKSLKRRTKRWNSDEIDKFISKADELGFHGVGTMALLCWHLCQRPGDVRQLTWDDYQNGILRFTQEKTGSKLVLPATTQIKERLNSIQRVNTTNTIVYYEKTGRAYDRRLYAKHAQIIRKAAGLDDNLLLSDLRRTGATEMANAGASDDLMRSVTGHKTRDVLSIYLVLDEETAAKAMQLRFGNA